MTKVQLQSHLLVLLLLIFYIIHLTQESRGSRFSHTFLHI